MKLKVDEKTHTIMYLKTPNWEEKKTKDQTKLKP